MSNVTPAAIKALREKTGAGMMECKAALTAAEGAEEKAIEILRKRGLASATKKEGRVAAEGVAKAPVTSLDMSVAGMRQRVLIAMAIS